MNFLDIPNQVLLMVGEYLSIKDLSCTRKTCRLLSSLLARRHYQLGVQNVGKLTALQWAAVRGHGSLAKQPILSGAEIEKQNELGQTPLHLAASGNHPDVIRILLEHGARISSQDSTQMTPLHYAASCMEAEATVLLLQLGAETMCEDASGDTPAFYAASMGGVACMEAFVNAGFDLNTRRHNSHTILHAAAYRSDGMMGYLLGQKEVKMAINAQDCFGATPLHLVLNSGSLRLLLI